MSKTMMFDYFKTIKKREVQLSSKNHSPIRVEAASNKKLFDIKSSTTSKESSSSCNASNFDNKSTKVANEVKVKASKKRKLSSERDAAPAKLNKLEEEKVTLSPMTECKSPAKVISSKDVRRFLKNPSNAEKVAQMRDSIQRINQLPDKLKQIRIPTPESDKPSVSVISSEKARAYQRHNFLTLEETPKLALPYKYKMLAEIFKCLDSVVSVMHNRHEICDFKKLKPALQQMLRRTFTLDHLGKIAAIFPNGFHFKQEKVHSYEAQGKVLSYQLTVYPNFDCFSNAGSSNQEYDNSPKGAKPQTFRSMAPNFLVSRQKFFYDSLVSVVKKQHEEFLSSLNPPIKLSSEKLIRWHPKFKLDDIADITPAPLPEPESAETYTTARDVLDKVRGLYNSKIDNALEAVASKSEDNAPIQPASLAGVSAPKTVKGIPLALLEKIRAREVAQIKANLTRNPVNELKLTVIGQLPEVSRIVRNLFVAEKRAAILYSMVATKAMESANGSVSLGDMERNVALLVELLPEWLTVVDIRSGKFLKINKQMNLNDVITKLEVEKKRLEQLC